MLDLTTILNSFDSISLPEMETVRLMDRLDAKFTFRIDQLPNLLQEMRSRYRLLEVGGIRANRYETLYFDTENLLLYSKHHAGKFTRYKIRFRKYVDSGLCFFEVKAKNNKGRTIKQRIERKAIENAIAGETAALLKERANLSAGDFRPVIWVTFTRLTFVNKTAPERLTIDLLLCYRNELMELSFPKLVIAEVKLDKSSAVSPFVGMMRQRRIWEGSMSKYCFGIVNLYPCVKMNLFKERVKQIKQLAA